MIRDALVTFIPDSAPLAITNGALASNVYDILGSGPGTAPQNIIGNRATFGADMGIGGVKPQLEALVGTAFLGGTSINIAFQGAPDTAVTFQPGTWQTLVETGAITLAQLTAGQVCARFDWPPQFPQNTTPPRYYRLLFTPVGVFTAGAFTAFVTTVRDDLANKQATRNYTVA